MLSVRLADLSAQHTPLKEELLREIEKVIDSGSFILDEKVRDFEGRFAEYCGVRYARGVANGTDALILALKALEIGPGDEVITAANSFVATAEAICHVGATPVFVDIDPATYNIDPNCITQTITSKTKAIIPVHLYGQPADMGKVVHIAQRHKLALIEDASQAHGAAFNGKRVGSFGHVACFSFYPAKNLGACGDAGAVVTDDEDLAVRISKLRDHGGMQKYQHDVVGFNSRLDAVQAVVLAIKLRYLDGWNQQRRQSAKRYDAGLGELPGIAIPATAKETTHVYHQYVVRVASGQRDELRAFLADVGIETGIHYPVPIHLTPAMAPLGYRPGDMPITEGCAKSILSLPIYPEMGEDRLSLVIRKIGEYMKSTNHKGFNVAAGAR